MKSISQQYRELQEGKMNKHQFMYNARMMFPDYITNQNSLEDSIKILKNRGLLTEGDAVKGTPDKAPEYSPIEQKEKYKKVEQEPEVQEQDGLYPATTLTDIPKIKITKRVKSKADGLVDPKDKDEKNKMKKVKNILKEEFTVEQPNGYVIKYFPTFQEASDWVDRNDPDGMYDFNIRSTENTALAELKSTISLQKLIKIAEKAGNIVPDVKYALMDLAVGYGDNIPKSEIKFILDDYDIDINDLKGNAKGMNMDKLDDQEGEKFDAEASDDIYETKLRSFINKTIREALNEVMNENHIVIESVETTLGDKDYSADVRVEYVPGSEEIGSVTILNITEYDASDNRWNPVMDENILPQLKEQIETENTDFFKDEISEYLAKTK